MTAKQLAAGFRSALFASSLMYGQGYRSALRDNGRFSESNGGLLR